MRVIGFVLATLALTSVCADKTFSIVENGGLSTLSFNISGTVVDKPQLNVTFGETITFRIEHFLQSTLDNKIIPFGLTASALALPQDFTSPAMGSLTPSNSCVLSTDTPNSWHVNQTTLTPCIITWKVVAPDSGVNFWYSSRNQAYAGPIEISGLPTGTPTTPAPGSNTTSPPTGTTTQAPTTTAPPTSTGKK